MISQTSCWFWYWLRVTRGLDLFRGSYVERDCIVVYNDFENVVLKLILTPRHSWSELLRCSYVQHNCNLVHNNFEIVAVDFDTDSASILVGAFPRFLCPAWLQSCAWWFQNRCCWLWYWLRVTRGRSISEVPKSSAIEMWYKMISKSLLLLLILTPRHPWLKQYVRHRNLSTCLLQSFNRWQYRDLEFYFC